MLCILKKDHTKDDTNVNISYFEMQKITKFWFCIYIVKF